MPKTEDLFSNRRPLGEICRIPDKIISVYSLEKHVWEDGNAPEARAARRAELRTIEEFQIDPVRGFLTDILRNMAAPYNPARRDNPIGQGYWIQAEFGSGKSHLLCFLSALALGDERVWNLVREKEAKARRGKRESLYQFWEDGLQAKSKAGKRGIFTVVKTLVGVGSGTVGVSDRGRRLSEYILDAAREQLQIETGKNISLYPTELLADRFLSEDMDRYRRDLTKFLRDPNFFNEDEFEDVNDFIRDIQQNESPDYKRSCGNKLWRFYTEKLKVQPHIAAETEEILKHLVQAVLDEGYSGMLLVLDEVSLFMKNRDDEQRVDDEQTLVVLANRLAKVGNLPIWTGCSAQQQVESKMGVKNIIAEDRLKLVELLKNDADYYDIVLGRVREIIDPRAIRAYYLFYKRGFTWPNSIGEPEFTHFFPFHKPAIEVLRAITYELTTARSAIHFMHQTLKHQIQNDGASLIRLWELFDETVRYEEDPSGVNAALTAIKTKRESEYRAYESCRRQIEALTHGHLKFHRDKAIKAVQTLFLYYVAHMRQDGLTPEDLANEILIERDGEANPEENIQHYEALADNLRKELRQIVQTTDDDKRRHYHFEPINTGAVDPRDEFRRARDEAETSEVMQEQAWHFLLGLAEWNVHTRQMTMDLASGARSIFRDIAAVDVGHRDLFSARPGGKVVDLAWQYREVFGLVEMRDVAKMSANSVALPPIDTEQTDWDFAITISTKPATHEAVTKLLSLRKDPRYILWTPAELSPEERNRLLELAAYRKLVADWQDKETEDAITVISWVTNTLQTEMGKIVHIVDSSYGRGQIDALNNTAMDYPAAGELMSILTPVVERVLNSVYESREIGFDGPYRFGREDAVKVINGIVKTGEIPRNAKPNQYNSAARNFGYGLKIMKKSAELRLDTSANRFIEEMWQFLDAKLPDDGAPMKVSTLYKNFMGLGTDKNYGLSRRMIQIFLLCLVHDAKIRVIAGPRSGLGNPAIDYTTIGDIDFSSKVLDAFSDMQKIARPEHWDVLRPYAEKLLGKEIAASQDDAGIALYRKELHEHFARERDVIRRLAVRARALFEALKQPNPYEQALQVLDELYATDLSGGDDIERMLIGLKKAFHYQASDTDAVDPTEVDDLANRLKGLRDAQDLLEYDAELKTAFAYSNHALPEWADLKLARRAQTQLRDKLTDLQTYASNPVKLRTELIGQDTPGDKGTLNAMIREYQTAYLHLHDQVSDTAEKARGAILQLQRGNEMNMLRVLDRVNALQPAVADEVEQRLAALAKRLFSCPSPSKTSVEESLQGGPVHICSLTFAGAGAYLQETESCLQQARALVDDGIAGKLQVLWSEPIRERLKQGSKEPLIAGLLACGTAAEARAYLLNVCQNKLETAELINRYLKRIVVKPVRLADFKPVHGLVQQSEIPELAQEFQAYLEQQIKDMERDNDDDALPMLKIE